LATQETPNSEDGVVIELPCDGTNIKGSEINASIHDVSAASAVKSSEGKIAFLWKLIFYRIDISN